MLLDFQDALFPQTISDCALSEKPLERQETAKFLAGVLSKPNAEKKIKNY